MVVFVDDERIRPLPPEGFMNSTSPLAVSVVIHRTDSKDMVVRYKAQLFDLTSMAAAGRT